MFTKELELTPEEVAVSAVYGSEPVACPPATLQLPPGLSSEHNANVSPDGQTILPWDFGAHVPFSGFTSGQQNTARSPSLVRVLHNSTITIANLLTCMNAPWLKGKCKAHETVRWIKGQCKKRTCPVCGEHRKDRIALRIKRGIEILGGPDGAGWFVGTFDRDIEKNSAVRDVGKFIRWLRKETGTHFEYASTWEVTERGRLHVNIIMAPWAYIPQSKLSAAWERFGGGRVAWIERVGTDVANETAKAGRERIGNYVGKWEQMVLTGRGVTYSKGWPKLPKFDEHRQGEIEWKIIPQGESESILFEDELNFQGYWRELLPGEYATTWEEACQCFERVPGPRPPVEAPRTWQGEPLSPDRLLELERLEPLGEYRKAARKDTRLTFAHDIKLLNNRLKNHLLTYKEYNQQLADLRIIYQAEQVFNTENEVNIGG